MGKRRRTEQATHEAVVVRLDVGHRLDPLDEGSWVEQRDGCDALVDGRALETFFFVRLLDQQRRPWAAEVEHDLGDDPLPDLGRAGSLLLRRAHRALATSARS